MDVGRAARRRPQRHAAVPDRPGPASRHPRPDADRDPATTAPGRLTANPAAVVHLESGDDVVIVEGRGQPMRDADMLARCCDAYEAKYASLIHISEPTRLGMISYAVFCLKK